MIVPRWRIGRSVHTNLMQRASKYFTDVEEESLLAVYQFLAIYAVDKLVFLFGDRRGLTVETRLGPCDGYLLIVTADFLASFLRGGKEK